MIDIRDRILISRISRPTVADVQPSIWWTPKVFPTRLRAWWQPNTSISCWS